MKALLIKNGCLVDSCGEKKLDILCVDGRIKEIGQNLKCDNAEILDADGLKVLPGLIDAHTHYHLVSRGTVTADSFAQGSRLAVFGGVTTVVDFADHNRGMNLVDSLNYRLDEMKDNMAVDYSLHQGVYGHGFDDTIENQLEELKKQGIKTLKIFTTYRETGYLLEDCEKLARLFRCAKKLGMLVTAHCEYNPMIEEISAWWKGTFLPKDHADLRPAEAEAKAIAFYGEAAFRENCPLYIVHVSSEAGLNEIRKLRKKGACIYAETTPTYLFLDRSKLEGPDGPLYVMTPPLRTKRDNEALLNALANGEIDVVATDHCSFTREQKLSSNDVRTVYPGIPGTEEMVHLLCNYAMTTGKISLNDIVRLTSTNPAKLFGLYPQKGSFELGSDADFAILNPDCEWTLSKEYLHSASGYTPYEGVKVKGKIATTILKGNVVMNGGDYYGKKGCGAFIRQND